MTTDDLKTVFNEYLGLENPQYAVLINGKWGSGKTFFYSKELLPLIQDRALKYVYLSLNGLSKIEQLEHLLFIRLIPVIRSNDSKALKSATSFLSNIANLASKHFLKASLTDLFKGVSMDIINLKNFVLILDDLERCEIPIKETLGYINSFIEHRNTKVLILADETNIDPNDDYNKHKEKAIGRVLNFSYEIENIFPQLIMKYHADSGYMEFLNSHSSYLIGILKNYGKQNLRMVSFLLEVIWKLHPNLIKFKLKTIQEALFFCSIITFEFKEGRLKSSQFNGYPELETANQIIFNKEVSEALNLKNVAENENTYEFEFATRYLKDRASEYVFFRSIYSYVLSGYLDQDALEVDLKIREPELLPEQEALERLIRHSFRELDNDEFSLLIPKVQDYASKGFYSIYRYVDIANFYYFFAKNCIVDLSVEDVTAFIDKGLEVSRLKEDLHEGELDHMLHFKNDDEDVEAIKLKVKEIHEAIRRKRIEEEGNSFIQALIQGDLNALRLLFQKYEFNKEFLINVDIQKLSEAIWQSNNKMIFNLKKLLAFRYKSTNIGDFLSVESAPLTTLNQNLIEALKGNEIPQPRLFVLNELVQIIRESIEKLQFSQPQP